MSVVVVVSLGVPGVFDIVGGFSGGGVVGSVPGSPVIRSK